MNTVFVSNTAGGSCTSNVTSSGGDNTGDHYTGTYEATLKTQDGTLTRVFTGGVFDAIF